MAAALKLTRLRPSRPQDAVWIDSTKVASFPSISLDTTGYVHYYPPPRAHQLFPSSGSVQGGTRVSVHGSRLFNTTSFKLRLRSGYMLVNVTVNCTLLNNSRAACLSPAVPLPSDDSPRLWSAELSIDNADVKRPLFVAVPGGYIFHKRESWNSLMPRTVSLAESGDTGTVITMLGDGVALQTLDMFESAAESARCRFRVEGDSFSSHSPMFEHRFRFARPARFVNPTDENLTDALALSLNRVELIEGGIVNTNCSDVRVMWLNSTTSGSSTDGSTSGGNGTIWFVPSWVQPDCERVWLRVSFTPREVIHLLVLFGGGVPPEIVTAHPFWRGTATPPSGIFDFFDGFESPDPFLWTYSGIASNTLPYEYSGDGLTFIGRTAARSVLTRTATTWSPPFTIEWPAVPTSISKNDESTGCESNVIAYLSHESDAEWSPEGSSSVRTCTAQHQMCIGQVCAHVNQSRIGQWRLDVGLDQARLSALEGEDIIATCATASAMSESVYFFLGADGPTEGSRAPVRWLATRFSKSNQELHYLDDSGGGGGTYTSRPYASWIGTLESASRAGIVQCVARSGVSQGNSLRRLDLDFAINAQEWQAPVVSRPLLFRQPVLRAVEPASVSVFGGEELTLQGENFAQKSRLHDVAKAADGASVWVRVGRAPAVAGIVEGNTSTRAHIVAPSSLIGGLPPLEEVSRPVRVSSDGQNFLDATNLAIETRPTCAVLSDDFDYVDNALVNTKLVGFRWIHWSKFEGGNASVSCAVAADSKHRYQALTFERLNSNSPNQTRELRTHAHDTRLGRANGTLSFSLRFLDGVGPYACAVVEPWPTWGNASTVALEFSNDGTHWASLANFLPDGSFELFAGTQALNGPGQPSPQQFFNYSISIPLEASAEATRFRWIQHSEGGEAVAGWAIDSVALRVIPTTDAEIEVHSLQPQSGPVGGGTNVTVRGDFSAAVKLGIRPHCVWYRAGAGSGFPGPRDTAFARWHAAGIESPSSELLDEATLRCVAPPFYESLRSEQVCAPEHKKMCVDCCFVQFTVAACGTRTVWRSTAVATEGRFAAELYPAADEFVYHERLVLDSK